MNESEPTGLEGLDSILEAKAMDISRHGIGEVSLMCRKSILDSMMTDPKMPEVHGREGVKFTKMAQRIAPPQILGDYIRGASRLYPPMCVLNRNDSLRAVEKVIGMTRVSEEGLSMEERGKGGNFAYSPSETLGYLHQCVADPELHLSCAYLAAAFQLYAFNLAGKIPETQMREDVIAFGKQMNALNLVTTLPVALTRSLRKLRGDKAVSREIDEQVIEETLAFLRESEQFTLKGSGARGTSMEGKTIELQCPMQGFMHDLLIRQKVLQTIIAATQRISEDSARYVREEGSFDAEMSNVLEIHHMNRSLVRDIAQYILAGKAS